MLTVALLNHYGAVPRACQPYRAKTKGKVERPFRYIRQDFFLARGFRNMDDLNAQFEVWRLEVANPRVHATTRRVVGEAFAEERSSLKPLPAIPYTAVLTVERRVSKDGMISVGGNFYSVPDTTRRRTLEVQHHATELRIFEDGQLIAWHPVLEGKALRRIDPSHRKAPPPRTADRPAPASLRRDLTFYDAVGRRLATAGARIMSDLLDRIHSALVGLKMPRALEALDHTPHQLEQGEVTAIEAIDSLLSEEYTTRETRRIDVALKTAKLMPIKTLEGFDFSFQPSLDRERIAALAQLDFIRRAEVIHFLGPPGTGKPHLATGLGVAAVKAGKSVYRATLAELVEAMSKAEREGRLVEKIRFYTRSSLLIVDEIGHLPITQGGANLFFQLVNARCEKGAMILTSNRGFAEWGEVFGDPVVAKTAGTATSDIRAVAFTPSRDGDSPILPELIGQIPEDEQIGAVTADGAYDTRRCHAAIIARDAEAIIPTRKNGRLWKEDCPAARAGNEARRATRHYGRAFWKRWTGYHTRSRIEAKMRCLKAFGERISARDPDRQTAEIHIRIALMNRFSALGTAEIVRVD